jgi:hypothetical protein
MPARTARVSSWKPVNGACAGAAEVTLSFRAGGTPEGWSAARNPPRTMENQGLRGIPADKDELALARKNG